MKTVYIIRDTIGHTQSLGAVIIVNKGKVIYDNHLLELGWRNNQRNISCTPAGKYDLVKEYSPAFEMDLWEAKGIPNRSETKFHPANYNRQLKGCYAPGEARFDMDRDGEKDMVNSKDAFEEFMDAMGNDTRARLVIINDHT